jgi:hypothetical protein
MARIFVSSTFSGMQRYREAAERTVRLARHDAVLLEYQGADASAPETYSADQVARCDAFVLLLGPHYGSTDPVHHKSYTQWEYEAAVQRGMKRIVLEGQIREWDDLLADVKERLALPDAKPEIGSMEWGVQQQIRFKRQVRTGATPTRFTDEAELREKLLQALHDLFPANVSPATPARPAVPRGGEILVRLCDRSDQLMQFGELFETMRERQDRRPQVFVLFGGTEQRHEACVERMLCYHVTRRFRDSPYSPTAPPKDQRVLDWPGEDLDEIRFNRLRRLVFKALDRDATVPSDFSTAAFWTRALALKADYIVLIHPLSAEEILASESLIRNRYLAFWDEVARHRLDAGTARPQFIVFFDVKCSRDSAVSGAALRQRLESMFRTADRAFEGSTVSAVTCVLPELGDIREADLGRWLTTYNEFLPPELRDRLPSELFPGFPVPMHVVERRLRDLMGFSSHGD